MSAEDGNIQNAAATRVDTAATADIGYVHEKMLQNLQNLLSVVEIREGFSSRSLCSPGKSKQQEHHAKTNTTNTTLTPCTLEIVCANLLRERKHVKYNLKYASESADLFTREQDISVQNKGYGEEWFLQFDYAVTASLAQRG